MIMIDINTHIDTAVVLQLMIYCLEEVCIFLMHVSVRHLAQGYLQVEM